MSVKVFVIGAGAIGGMLAVKLSLSGEDVSLCDRGSHLAAIRDSGLKLQWQDGQMLTARPTGYERAEEAGVQDLVVLAVKSYDLEQAVQGIDALLGPETVVLTVQNGLPWWYFQREGGSFDGHVLTTLDPRGVLAAAIDPNRILGCVAYPAAVVEAPGFIKHIEGNRFPVGELDGRETERASDIAAVLGRAGLKSRVIDDIRAEIWLKAWGSLSFNPISALTHATMEQICRYPETRQLAADLMTEAQIVAEKLGIRFRHTIEKRLAGAEAVGAHKTSMLQDLEHGDPFETEALVGSVLEIGRLTKTPTPMSSTIYALLGLLENTVQRSGGRLKVEKRAANQAKSA